MKTVHALLYLVQIVMQRLALVVFLAAAFAMLVATTLAAFGLMSWISLPIQYQGVPIENAGMYLQIGLTVLAIGISFFLPTNHRIMQLENSHRQFSISMNDVARAYTAVHAADRQRTFQLSSEFDAVRERLAYLRDHPDLSTLEPALLEVAAQMSHISTDLAQVYADDKITRARQFLEQRQEEIDLFNSRLDQAKGISTELKQWVHEVELEESVAAAQLERLREEMHEIMPELGIETIVCTADDVIAEQSTDVADNVDTTLIDNTVIEMPPKAAE